MSIDELNEEQWKEINKMMQRTANLMGKFLRENMNKKMEELENEQAAS